MLQRQISLNSSMLMFSVSKALMLVKKDFIWTAIFAKALEQSTCLKKYWDGAITGYLFEDTKKWINKRIKKKRTQRNAHLTDDIVALERAVRADTREYLKPFIEQAKQYELEIKTKYCYITKAFEELNSRPEEGYTYTLIADIANFNEKR